MSSTGVSSSKERDDEIKKIAMIGCGAMGGGMALLFAEKGCDVILRDPSPDAMDTVLASARQDKLDAKLSKAENDEELCKAFGNERKVFFWSIPHGHVGDTVLDGLMPYLQRDDIVVDCANEHWENTERRMGKCAPKGIRYVGMGVSGGYQAARRGSSMCAGTDRETFDILLPLLEKAAATASDGSACVGWIGTGGAGHYCKMIHNGIEHGMMGAMCEVWRIMSTGLDMSPDEIADVFEAWNAAGELHGTFLIRIGADICRATDDDGERVLATVEDKVVQDVCGEEGTGVWSNLEALAQHVPAPTLTSAHHLRLASANLHLRRTIHETLGGDFPPPRKLDPIHIRDRAAFLEDLRLATYAACLAAYTQGMHIILRADDAQHFHIDYAQLFQIWRAGCIIQADYISSHLLLPHRADFRSKTHPLTIPAIAASLKSTYPSLKRVVVACTEADHVVPTVAATLDYLRVMASVDLPTSFQEAQLDYFGRHMFDVKGEDEEGRPVVGKRHFEWKAA